MTWTLENMLDQSGKTFLVTGVTSGLGTHTVAELTKRNARVILAARSADKLDQTASEITGATPRANLEKVVVDLANLGSVRRAAEVVSKLGPIDVLINNAGVMATPRQRTVDGLDLQMQTNHFAPFLLTGLLLPQLAASGDGRVVALSSNGHKLTRHIPLDDPRVERRGRYQRWDVYCQSKLANLMFTYELDRRLRAAGQPVKALAAHPGYAATHLLAAGQTSKRAGLAFTFFNGVAHATAQPADMGALPTLMAATEDLPGSTYVGPRGFQELRGLPHIVSSTKLSHNERGQKRLWEISEETVGLSYP